MAAKQDQAQSQSSESAATPQDPRAAGPQPPYPKQDQEFPGSDADLKPRADHGEESYRGSGKLEGCAAVITGADSGIGRAVAIAFAREGADVLITYLSEDDDAAETARWVEKAGRKAIRVAGDIQQEDHCRRIIQEAVDQFGKLDILVNNAAYQMPHDQIEEFSSEQFERTFRTNLFSMFYLCKAAMPQLQPGSSIINTASIQAYDPSGELLDYATTKSAIVGFTKSLSKTAMDRGVRVNAVAPGPVWTPLIPYSFPEEKTSNFGKNTLQERPAQPAELAPIYVLLASKEASYITGEVYGATGGRSPV